MVNAKLIDKIERGDSISNNELLDARQHYKELADLLGPMGQRWGNRLLQSEPRVHQARPIPASTRTERMIETQLELPEGASLTPPKDASEKYLTFDPPPEGYTVLWNVKRTKTDLYWSLGSDSWKPTDPTDDPVERFPTARKLNIIGVNKTPAKRDIPKTTTEDTW